MEFVGHSALSTPNDLRDDRRVGQKASPATRLPVNNYTRRLFCEGVVEVKVLIGICSNAGEAVIMRDCMMKYGHKGVMLEEEQG
jgi:hypothetical protein